MSPAREYIDEGIRIIYDQLRNEVPKLCQDGWVIVDTTSTSIEKSVSMIIQKTMIEGIQN